MLWHAVCGIDRAREGKGQWGRNTGLGHQMKMTALGDTLAGDMGTGDLLDYGVEVPV